MPVRGLVALALTCWHLHGAYGDCYMHNPRGSNNKMTEQSNNAANQNRLFDSQNNAAGGYQVGDNCVPNCKNGNQYDASKTGSQEGVMQYFHGSELYVEWTSQHACGTPGNNVNCNFVIQYMCNSDAPNLRDGKDPDSGNRRRSAGGNNNNPAGANKADSDDPVRPRHESFESYDACRKRQRNQGLYNADQNLNQNIGAAATRQNPNGNRRGLECPEERDYYPYWHPTEWRDAAVFTSNGALCAMYQNESQNVRSKGFCTLALPADAGATLQPEEQVPNNAKACEQRGGSWQEQPAWGISAPDCLGLPESRDNHLGNTQSGNTQYWKWEIPESIPDNDLCVLRIRYNISTADFNKVDDDFDAFWDLDSSLNGANAPLKGNPKDDFVGLGMQLSGPLQVQVNTQQFGRTFQDRSHAFRVSKRPNEVSKEARIVNYNVRGRRGNIVQVYPSVEYDFVPQDIEVSVDDYIHFQWTGSDANANGNAGNGRQGTDRSNLVQISVRGGNKPLPVEEQTLFFDAKRSLVNDDDEGRALVAKFAFLNQEQYAEAAGTTCPASAAEAAELNDNDDNNCQQLNAGPAYFDGGLVKMQTEGRHHIASTRNNDFSNRSQKTTITVTRRGLRAFLLHSSPILIVGVAVTVCLILASLCLTATALYALLNPTSAAFSKRNRPFLLRLPCFRCIVAAKEKERREYKETLARNWEQRCKSAQTVDPLRSSADQESGRVMKSGAEASQMALPPIVRSKLGGFFSDHAAFLLLLAANLAIGGVGYARNFGKGFNHWYAVAKSGGYMLDFDLSLLLLPTLRSAQTVIHQVPALDGMLPDPIAFHMQVAGFVLLGTCVHVIGHGFHSWAVMDGPVFFPAVTPQQQMSGTPWWALLLDPSTRAAPLTGLVILFMMAVIFLTATDSVRRQTFNFKRLPRSVSEIRAFALLFFAAVFASPVLLVQRVHQCCFGARTRSNEDLSRFGGFRIFWAAHKNWLHCYALLLIHGPNFWIWFLWPMLLVICDRLLRSQRRQATARLQSVELLKSHVMKLTFSVPRGFAYQAGHYVQLCCDQISLEEWHPFTISSAPEQNYLSVHIRCPDSLDWCSALRRRLVEEPVAQLSKGSATSVPGCKVSFKRHSQPCGGDEQAYDRPQAVDLPGADGHQAFHASSSSSGDLKMLENIDEMSVAGIPLPHDGIQMRLDGPHGAPSELVWKHRVVVLVGAGIGVTPFASILRSAQMRSKKTRTVEKASTWSRMLAQSKAENVQPSDASQDESWEPCEIIYFYWLCRGQEEFEWFYDMLREAIGGPTKRHIEVNLFQTGEVELSKVKALGCGFGQFFGRPNWGRIFPKLAEEHPEEDIGVFLCGPAAIRNSLQDGVKKAHAACVKNGSSFIIHSENF